MGVLTIGTILGIELGKFAVRDYLFSKAADIGTGKLWEEIKNILIIMEYQWNQNFIML